MRFLRARRSRGRSSALLLALALAAAASCGKKGPPLPPLRPVFPSIPEVRFLQRGEDLILEWTVTRPAGEGKRAAVTGFRILRAPLGPSREGPDLEERVARGLFATLAEADPFELEAGPVFRYRDEGVGGREVGYLYAVELVTDFKGRGVRGPIYRWHPSSWPEAPRRLRVEPEPEGLHLSWETSDDGRSLPVHIYRGPAEARVSPEILAETSASYLDESVALDRAYRYYAARVAAPDEGAGLEKLGVPEEGRQRAPFEAVAMQVESELAGPAEATYVDLYPPPVPENLRAFPEDDAVVLLWNPVEAHDLAGYHVYRAAPDGEPRRLTDRPTQDTVYRDTDVAPGDRWTYTVTSVDTRPEPNESEPSEPDEAVMERRDVPAAPAVE